MVRNSVYPPYRKPNGALWIGPSTEIDPRWMDEDFAAENQH